MTSSHSAGAAPAARPPNSRGQTLLARRKRPLGAIALIATALFFITSPLVTSQNDTSTPAASVATPAADATRLRLTFEELNDSGISGTATLYEMGAQTLVELDLDGTGDNHPTHIHEGTCETIEPVAAYDLTNVGEDGASTTLINVSLSDLLNGEYVIDLHLAPDQLGLLIACTEITGTPVNAQGTPVAVGGNATPTTTVEGTETPEATVTEAVTPEVTAEPTGEGGEVTPTATAEVPSTVETTSTPVSTVTAEATATPGDGTGGQISGQTPIAGDGTDGGKGVAVTPLTPAAPVAVGGTSTGDGTNADGSIVGSGKGEAVGGASNLPVNTGSGDSLILPTTPTGAIVWASGGFAFLLLTASWLVRRGEHHRAPGRWRRLGL